MAQSLFDLSGRVALITGASRGIGAEMARLLAAHGAKVVITSRKAASCEALADDIRRSGGQADARACHTGSPEAIEQTVAAVGHDHGKIDILINNAATNPYFGPVLDIEPGAFDKTVDVNLRGYFLMSVTVGRMMRAAGRGVILNTASVNGLVPAHGQAVYSMTKAAVISLTRSFAKECGPHGIRVNALLPGLTSTKFIAAFENDKETFDGILETIPLGRAATASEQARAALFLVSDASSYVTGASLLVDGGILA